RAEAFANPLYALIISQHRLIWRTPVDIRRGSVRKPAFTESQKQPLGPAIVFCIGCVQAPGPVKAQPVPANGFGLGLNVFVGEDRGSLVATHGGVVGGT